MRWFRKGTEDNSPRLISLSPLRQLDSTAAADAEVASVGRWGSYHSAAIYPRSGQVDEDTSSTLDLPLPSPHNIQHRRSRSALSDNMAADRSSSYADHQHHLPCTLKRKPAVRRRSGGKGMQRFDLLNEMRKLKRYRYFKSCRNKKRWTKKKEFEIKNKTRNIKHNCRPISGNDLLTFRILWLITYSPLGQRPWCFKKEKEKKNTNSLADYFSFL